MQVTITAEMATNICGGLMVLSSVLAVSVVARAMIQNHEGDRGRKSAMQLIACIVLAAVSMGTGYGAEAYAKYAKHDSVVSNLPEDWRSFYDQVLSLENEETFKLAGRSFTKKYSSQFEYDLIPRSNISLTEYDFFSALGSEKGYHSFGHDIQEYVAFHASGTEQVTVTSDYIFELLSVLNTSESKTLAVRLACEDKKFALTISEYDSLISEDFFQGYVDDLKVVLSKHISNIPQFNATAIDDPETQEKLGKEIVCVASEG